MADIIGADTRTILNTLGSKATALSGKTVLIVGAGGFLPAYIADTLATANDSGLLDRPCRLVLLVRNPERADDRLSRFTGRPDTDFVYADVSGNPEFPCPADYVVYAASPTSPIAFRRNPVECLDANIVGLRGMLERAREWNVESFLYFSSSEVYGSPEPDAIPTPETYVGRINQLGKRAPYGEGKRAGEAYCHCYFEQYGLPVKIVRPFHTYGPGLRLDDMRIVGSLIANAVRSEMFTLDSDGRAMLSHCYAADATIDFMNVLLSHHDGEAFNVGNDVETSVLQLATLVSRLAGRERDVVLKQSAGEGQQHEPPRRICPDLSKIRAAFGHYDRVGLEEGLERTLRWRGIL